MNQTINISLSSSLLDLANKHVESGYYSSVSEIVRDALRRLFSDPPLPTIKLSDKANKIALQAMEDYYNGKTKTFTSVSELL